MSDQKVIMEQNKRNKVRFNDNVAVHEIIHCSDLTEKEIADTWYTKEETVHKLERTLRIADNECRRGLENVRSSKRRNHRQRRIKKAVLNVLNEQERQKVFNSEYNDYGTEQIALVNAVDNSLAISKALELGLMDYQYIKENVTCECNVDEQEILVNTKQMSTCHSVLESSIMKVPGMIVKGEKKPKCLANKNTSETSNCFQYELELKSNTIDLTTWSVSLSISVVQ